MKPTTTQAQPGNLLGDAIRVRRSSVMPQTECYFRAPGLTAVNPCGGNCGTGRFRDISNGYFDYEAPRAFATDAVVFGAILLTVVVPLVNSASAMWHMLRAVGGGL